jgi:two-component system NtrC family sensor kinase
VLDDSIRLVNSEYKQRVAIVAEYAEMDDVECSPQLMSQVFINILVNAAQAIEGQGTITVRTRQFDGMAETSIADTGSGMTEACKRRIFATGFSTKPLGVGTGLGLPISRKIVVERHGGTLTFESELGKGTVFFIRIPMSRGAKEQ